MWFHPRATTATIPTPPIGDPTTDDQLTLDLVDLAPPQKRSASGKSPHEERNLETHPQTRTKLDGYRRYVPRYVGILGSFATRVFILDPFGGSGRVRDGLGWADGSPLIACRAAQKAKADFARRGRDVTFSLRFVEVENDARATLEDLVEPFHAELDIKVLAGKAGVHIEALAAIADFARNRSLVSAQSDQLFRSFRSPR